MQRARHRRLTTLAALAALGALAIATALVLTRSGDPPDLRAGSEELGPGPHVAIGRTPLAYRVVYQVEEHSPSGTEVSTEVLAVRRPFDSRLEVWAGPPPGVRIQRARVSTFARFGLDDPDRDDPAVFTIPPAATGSDVRLAPLLDDALAGGHIERRERRQVAGRACQVYRSAGSLTGALGAGTDDDQVDTCVDGAGLVLEEVVVEAGRITVRRLAVEVDEDPDLPDSLFALEDPEVPIEQGGGSVIAVDPDSLPEGEFWELPQPPAGFAHEGRYSVVPPQAENFTDPERIGHRLAMVVDIWVRGPDLLIVEQGGTLHGFAPFAANPANPTVALGDLGTGELVLTGRGAQLSVLRGGGRFVRVTGTLAPDALTAVAVALDRVEGDGLRFG